MPKIGGKQIPYLISQCSRNLLSVFHFPPPANPSHNLQLVSHTHRCVLNALLFFNHPMLPCKQPSLTGGSCLSTSSLASTPAPSSSSSRPTCTGQHDTGTSGVSKYSAPQEKIQVPSIFQTKDTKAFIPFNISTSNPFANLHGWQALGFENPHVTKKVDASFNANDTSTKPPAKSACFYKPAHSGVQKPKPWTGSELFNESHRTLEPGQTIFDSAVNERQRWTYLAGFGRDIPPPLVKAQERGRRGERFRGGKSVREADLAELQEWQVGKE